MIGFLGLFLLSMSAVSVSALTLNDIPNELNDALFDDANMLWATKTLLSATILVAGLLPFAVMKPDPIVLILIGLVIMMALFAIGWLDIVILIVALLIVASMWAGHMRDIFGSGSGG